MLITQRRCLPISIAVFFAFSAPVTTPAQNAQSDEFTLTFEDGQSRTFKNNLRACEMEPVNFAECRSYELLARKPDTQAYVVKENFYEGGVYRLISSRTGTEVLIATEPEYSPNLKRLVSVEGSESSYNRLDYDIAIYRVAAPATLEWKYTAPQDQYELWSFVGWDGDDRIKLRVQTHSGQFDADATRTVTGWQLNWPKK